MGSIDMQRTFYVLNMAIVQIRLTPVFAGAQEVPQRLATFLRDRVALKETELADIRRGKAVAKVLPSEKQEVALLGVILVNASADFFVERFRDIESYKKGSVPVVKKFSDPPRIEDLDQLQIDKKDFDALKNCKIGSCDVKLSAEAIGRLQREIDWKAPDALDRVNDLARASLLEYVKRYLAGGNNALSIYNDKKEPKRIAEQFDEILKASPYVYDDAPEFYQYLQAYPAKHLDNAEDFIYWSKEKFGLKPVISVTHVTIYRKPGAGPTLISSKQIYASHYFEASLGLTAVTVTSQTKAPSFYPLYDNFHVRGYKEEGTSTTPFDMTVLNDLDRFHLAGDVVDRVPRLQRVGAHFKQFLRNKLAEHQNYICEYGEDLPEIRDWKWPY